MANIEKIDVRGWAGSADMKRRTNKAIRRAAKQALTSAEPEESVIPGKASEITHGWVS